MDYKELEETFKNIFDLNKQVFYLQSTRKKIEERPHMLRLLIEDKDLRCSTMLGEKINDLLNDEILRISYKILDLKDVASNLL